MFKQRLGEAVFHFVAVKDLTFDDRLKRETVFDVAHLVQDLLHLFRCCEKLRPLSRFLFTEADQITAITL